MKKTFLTVGLLAAAAAAWADPTDEQVTRIMMRDFHAKGQAKMDRLEQDGVQRLCTVTHNKPPEATAKLMEADQLKTIVYPSGSLLGDWRRGEKIASSGKGMQWNEKAGPGGGGCYNCHQLSPKQPSYGTIGPSLKGFGRIRGNGVDMQRYVYGKIYNAKAYSLCSEMPRFGYTGSLSEQQMKDLTALLLDPDSPVNQ